MKVKSFHAEGVNGYLDFNIEFNDKLNFLIGINGAGKTTAINLMLGLLSPSWFNLTQIKYKIARITGSHEGMSFEILSENVDGSKIRLSFNKEDFDQPITSIIRRLDLPEKIVNEMSRLELRQALHRQSRLEGNFLELDAVKEIRKMETPVFLGLDRRIHKGDDIDLLNLEHISRGREINDEAKGNLSESLKDVEELIKTSFLIFTKRQNEISNTLKNKIISSSFDIIEKSENEFMISTQSKIDIPQMKERIISASQNFDIPDLESKINNYFDELNEMQFKLNKIQNKSNKKNNASDREFMEIIESWFINSPQLKRIENIISLYENAQNEITKESSKFQHFEKLANQFFIEGGKAIRVKNGLIDVVLPNEVSSNIYKLSSGEKQILVMLAQLIFGEQRSIFIIDEPELSLHLGWQEIFVEAIVNASEETQFILATHSPTIVGGIENEIYCRPLN